MTQMTEADLIQLGRQLKEMRELAGISTAQMAVNCEKTVRTIENWEAGRNNPGRIGILAYEHFTRKKLRGQAKSTSSCDYFYGSQDSLPFDEEVVIDLRELVTNLTYTEPRGLYVRAS